VPPSGVERRFGWVLDNTLAALKEEMIRTRGPLVRQYRSAEAPIESALEWVSQHVGQVGHGPVDVLDSIASKRTREELEAHASPISRQWGILTGVQPREFAEALRAAFAR